MYEMIIDLLINTPCHILMAQSAYNEADRAYQIRLAEVTINALSAAIFPGKDGALRAATNDTERAAAVDKLTATDERLTTLRIQRESALTVLQYHKNVFDGAMRAARLLSSKDF